MKSRRTNRQRQRHASGVYCVSSCLVLATATFITDAFLMDVVHRHPHSHGVTSTTRCNNWLGDLWEEVIEFSTYGPAERKVLKAKRMSVAATTAALSDTNNTGLDDISVFSFQQAKRKLDPSPAMENGRAFFLSLQAFQSTVPATVRDDYRQSHLAFDGYALRDLLVSKWGVPLDVDFQRGYSQQTVHCTVFPVAFGSSKCRHVNELDYLMHLQAVVETLDEYSNLDEFRAFLDTTTRTLKPGVESIPFRLELSPQQLRKVLRTPS